MPFVSQFSLCVLCALCGKSRFEVEWPQDKKWYPATILKAWYGLHLVHYDNYDSTVDEWAAPGTIRLRSE